MKSVARLTIIGTALLFAVSANATPISFGFLESEFDKEALLADSGPTANPASDLTGSFGAGSSAPGSTLFSGKFGAKGANSVRSAFGGACSPAGMLEFQSSGGLCGGKLGNARSGGSRLVFVDGDDGQEGGDTRTIPEPGTLLLLGGGLMILGFVGRRRKTFA